MPFAQRKIWLNESGCITNDIANYIMGKPMEKQWLNATISGFSQQNIVIELANNMISGFVSKQLRWFMHRNLGSGEILSFEMDMDVVFFTGKKLEISLPGRGIYLGFGPRFPVYFCPGYGCLFEKWETYDIYSIFRLAGPKKHQDWVGLKVRSSMRTGGKRNLGVDWWVVG